MGFFSKILDKLGIHKKDEAAPTSGSMPAAPAPAPAKPAMAPTAAPAQHASAPAPVQAKPVAGPVVIPVPAKPVAVSEVDVVKHLEELAATKKGLDWKVSIVDLLKLLDIDSSFEARKELATELGCPAELMGDSAKMNVWLHKTVLKKIAENGGNIPQSMLD